MDEKLTQDDCNSLGAGFLDTPASVSRESTETEIGTTTAAAPVEYATLDEEIGNVMSSLGSFWGKVRKQVRSSRSVCSHAIRSLFAY